jgi:hypothetical protein
MTLKSRQKIDQSKTFEYQIHVNDWAIDVEFNHYASRWPFESDVEFEESCSIILNGYLVDTNSDSKKLNMGLLASLRIYANNSLYDSRGQYSIDQDDRTIGRMVYQRFFETEKKGHFLSARIYIPTNMSSRSRQVCRIISVIASI